MTARGLLSAIALAAMFAVPGITSAAIVQQWQTAPGVSYRVRSLAGDVNGDGVYDLITDETSGANQRVGIRSGATGALIAQTALAYKINDFVITDLDGDGVPEILIEDINTGHYLCFNWTTGSSTLALRWTTSTVFSGRVETAFVDFDGTGKLYTVFMASGDSHFFVYDRTGVLVSTVTIPQAPTAPPAWTSQIQATDMNQDAKQEVLIHYSSATGDQDRLWLYQSSLATGVEPGSSGPLAVELGPSHPNPTFSLSRVDYSMPTSGPATLRLFDVSGREVRTLVEGPVPAGRHEATWDGRDAQGRQVPAGAYFYELNAAGQRQTRRVVRLQ